MHLCPGGDRPHSLANFKAGNDTTTQISALTHCIPYIGSPRALNAIRIIGATL